MLSLFAIGCLQCRQCDRGAAIDSPAGKRTMQTLRKLPSSKPLTAKKIHSIEDHSSTAKRMRSDSLEAPLSPLSSRPKRSEVERSLCGCSVLEMFFLFRVPYLALAAQIVAAAIV